MQEMTLVLDLLDMPMWTAGGLFFNRPYDYSGHQRPTLIPQVAMIKFEGFRPYIKIGVLLSDVYSNYLDEIIPKGTKVIFDIGTSAYFVIIDNTTKCVAGKSKLNLVNEKDVRTYCRDCNITYSR